MRSRIYVKWEWYLQRGTLGGT